MDQIIATSTHMAETDTMVTTDITASMDTETASLLTATTDMAMETMVLDMGIIIMLAQTTEIV